ncbi:hypothetical protein B0J17DRAFT_649085 [Rhizoctonia solani]|nr:hypothetical protein B0J17DRAFT_649085 [Rhizoctonia solani]
MDRSLLSASGHFEDSINYDKENTDRNNALNIMLPTSPIATAKVLTPVALNRGPDSPSQLHKAISMDVSVDEDKLTAMISPERRNGGFGEGVRRESFPRKYVHTPDVSFNSEDAFIGDKSYSSDVTHGEEMSFAYNARSSTPVSAHEVPIPPTVQRTRPDPGVVEPASNALSESDLKVPGSTLNMGLDRLDAAVKPRATHPRSPLSFEVDAATEGRHGAPTRESELVPAKHNNSSKKLQSNGNLAPPALGLKSISARAAALRFILPEDSLMEMDSILDVQFPGGMEDEFTAAFARLALGASGSGPKVAEPRFTTTGPAVAPREQVLVGSDQHGSLATVGGESQGRVGPTESNPTPGEANDSYIEDEQTLNIASLGLSEAGNSLLMDTSLDQLRSKPDGVEHADATFGGSSFVIGNSSATGWPTRATLEVHTPKRTDSNPLPQVEGTEMGVEATVRKPQVRNGRVASDVVVDALRSGRALHRATSSVSSVSGTAGLTNDLNGNDERPMGKQVWPGSTASLRRTESFGTYPHPNTAEPRQYPGSAIPLQRARSTMSLRRTSSATAYQSDFMRPHSRASDVDIDSEDDQPYTPIPTMSRGSSRRSSVYALPEPGIPSDHPVSNFDRPSSVASIYDRPTSAASIRPTSAASIRPTSAASIRTSSTRPTSVADSLRSGSAASSRRVSGAHVRTSSAEDELVKGMEALMGGNECKVPATPTARNTQDAQYIRSTKVAGVTKDNKGVPRSAIKPLGLSTPRPTGLASAVKSGLGPPKSLGSKILSGVPGPKQLIGPSTRATGLGSSAKTMSATTGRAVPMTPVSGTRSTTSTLRSQSSITSSAVRTRATTLGLFAPDGGPGVGQEHKRLTHKASSSSISATPSTTRILRPPATTSGTRTLVPRGATSNTGPTRAVAGSIASLREAMKSKETSKR